MTIQNEIKKRVLRVLNIVKFLKESNAIEGVYDKESFKNAWKAWSYLIKQKELTQEIILKTHKILMRNHLDKEECGHYRKCQVWVGGKEGFKWPHIYDAMEVWRINAWLYPKNWKEHHIRFEKIHPFIDGNGRIGRMLMNWQRKKVGLDILIIKESEKQKYYQWFN